MAKNRLYVLGGALVIGFAALSLLSFKQTLTPYVTYADARADQRIVQVAGGLEQGSSWYDSDSESLHFTLTDPESDDTLKVRYDGLKPANFEDAVSIVAIGRFDDASGVFQAEKLLVKCPSKYQGVEVKEYS